MGDRPLSMPSRVDVESISELDFLESLGDMVRFTADRGDRFGVYDEKRRRVVAYRRFFRRVSVGVENEFALRRDY